MVVIVAQCTTSSSKERRCDCRGDDVVVADHENWEELLWPSASNLHAYHCRRKILVRLRLWGELKSIRSVLVYHFFF